MMKLFIASVAMQVRNRSIPTAPLIPGTRWMKFNQSAKEIELNRIQDKRSATSVNSTNILPMVHIKRIIFADNVFIKVISWNIKFVLKWNCKIAFSPGIGKIKIERGWFIVILLYCQGG